MYTYFTKHTGTFAAAADILRITAPASGIRSAVRLVRVDVSTTSSEAAEQAEILLALAAADGTGGADLTFGAYPGSPPFSTGTGNLGGAGKSATTANTQSASYFARATDLPTGWTWLRSENPAIDLQPGETLIVRLNSAITSASLTAGVLFWVG